MTNNEKYIAQFQDEVNDITSYKFEKDQFLSYPDNSSCYFGDGGLLSVYINDDDEIMVEVDSDAGEMLIQFSFTWDSIPTNDLAVMVEALLDKYKNK